MGMTGVRDDRSRQQLIVWLATILATCGALVFTTTHVTRAGELPLVYLWMMDAPSRMFLMSREE